MKKADAEVARAKAEATSEMKLAAMANAKATVLEDTVTTLRKDLAQANAAAQTSLQAGFQAGVAQGRSQVLDRLQG